MRTRTIKPGFFDNEVLGSLPPLHRLLFIGLWTMADRDGRLEDRPKKIRKVILGYDDVSDEGTDEMLQALSNSGFLVRYSVNGDRYIQIVHFLKHQSPAQSEKESEIPPPPKEIIDQKPNKKDRCQDSKEAEPEIMEENRRESAEEPAEENKQVVTENPKQEENSGAEESGKPLTPEKVKDLYNGTCKRLTPISSMSSERRKSIERLIRAGNKREDFVTAFRNAQESDYLCGDNEHRFRATFDWIMNPSNFEKVKEGNYKNRGSPSYADPLKKIYGNSLDF